MQWVEEGNVEIGNSGPAAHFPALLSPPAIICFSRQIIAENVDSIVYEAKLLQTGGNPERERGGGGGCDSSC